MTEKAKELRREYLRQWRKKQREENPERLRKYAETYWTRRLEREENSITGGRNNESKE